MIVIENSNHRVSISEKGAELQEIFSKETQLEYLWSGDPVFWGKKSPVLFPIVGTLKNDSFHHNRCCIPLATSISRSISFSQ